MLFNQPSQVFICLSLLGGAQGLGALSEEVPLAVVAVPGQAARHPEEHIENEAAKQDRRGRAGRDVQLQHLRQRLLHPLLAEGAQEQALGHTGGKSCKLMPIYRVT